MTLTDPPPTSRLKRLLDRMAPFLYRPLRNAYRRHLNRQFLKRYQRFVGHVTQKIGSIVQTGPFAGMCYVKEAKSSALLPKLIGTYEDELHPALERFFTEAYSAVVDIGCAEGYYAVGLACRLPSTTVHAYDRDPLVRSLCRELAERNGVVDRVVIHESFAPDLLSGLPKGRLLVICDVEGYEVQLFTPETAQYWRGADLIVELHDFLGFSCREVVRECLSPSHTIELISSRAKTPPKLDALGALSEADLRLAVDELRPPQEWIVARPK